MNGPIRIKCRGGTASRVKVTIDGKTVSGIREIEILPIKPGGLVMARITARIDLDIETPHLTEESPT